MIDLCRDTIEQRIRLAKAHKMQLYNNVMGCLNSWSQCIKLFEAQKKQDKDLILKLTGLK